MTVDAGKVRSLKQTLIGIADTDEIKRLKNFVDSANPSIRQLPWAVKGVNDGKGPSGNSLPLGTNSSRVVVRFDETKYVLPSGRHICHPKAFCDS